MAPFACLEALGTRAKAPQLLYRPRRGPSASLSLSCEPAPDAQYGLAYWGSPIGRDLAKRSLPLGPAGELGYKLRCFGVSLPLKTARNDISHSGNTGLLEGIWREKIHSNSPAGEPGYKLRVLGCLLTLKTARNAFLVWPCRAIGQGELRSSPAGSQRTSKSAKSVSALKIRLFRRCDWYRISSFLCPRLARLSRWQNKRIPTGWLAPSHLINLHLCVGHIQF